jgi:hypothetical protein
MSSVTFPNQYGYPLVTGGGWGSQAATGVPSSYGGKTQPGYFGYGRGLFGTGTVNTGREGGIHDARSFKQPQYYINNPEIYSKASATASLNAQRRAAYAQSQRGWSRRRRHRNKKSTTRRRVAKRKTHRR